MTEGDEPREIDGVELPSRKEMDRFSGAIEELLNDREFDSVEEMNAYLQEHVVGRTLDEIADEDG